MKYNLDHVSVWVGVVKVRQEIVECMNDLRPELQAILDLELQAGNLVFQASQDWPDPGSIFITFSQPFHRTYAVKDPVKYSEPNDPHYWKADYSCGKPVHILAY
ncbi:MAG: hypothetical protein JW755_05090 [Candidatus Aminicenantes bacterium]|nr:hypothetical protein [Candidatus Aminicenantes bacterium]